MPRTILALTAVVLLLSFPATAADRKDATGTWEWTYKTKDGKDAKVSIRLKQEGDKLTGVFNERAGGQAPIANGTIDAAGKLAFDVTRTISGEQRLFKYRGQLADDGNAITGKIDFIKDGKAYPHDWEAKRVKE